jgi:UDP-N-acetyl-2-amino-2-deoxyglucuronate dehydrogenase
MSRKIGVAVVGCGRIGLTHLEAIKEIPDRVNLTAIVDINPELLHNLAEKYRPKRIYTLISEALKDQEIEAIILALPHNLHCPIPCRQPQPKSIFWWKNPWRPQ